MGISRDDFWEMTEEEFLARNDVYLDIEKRWNLRFGVIAAVQANANRAKDSPVLTPGDFFGYNDQPNHGDMSDEQMLEMMQSFGKKQASARTS